MPESTASKEYLEIDILKKRVQELEKLYKNLEDVYRRSYRESKKLSKLVNDNQKTITAADRRTRDTARNTEHVKSQVFNSLAIFVALFTFISIEFQLFKTQTDWNIAFVITLIFSGMLLNFVLVFDYLINKYSTLEYFEETVDPANQAKLKRAAEIQKRKFVTIASTGIGLIVIGLILFAWFHTETAIINHNEDSVHINNAPEFKPEFKVEQMNTTPSSTNIDVNFDTQLETSATPPLSGGNQ